MPDAGHAAAVACTGLTKRHGARGGVIRRRGADTQAVAGVTLAVARGEIYGLVGSSGAGKSTLARMLALLDRPDAGEIAYDGVRVDQARGARLRRLRRVVQIVFQDPGASLDPLQRVGAAVEEPLAIHRLHAGAGRAARTGELLTSVGLPSDESFRSRYPRELSGGEQQRVAIARALACEPKALVLDEPVSALDVSIRGQVLNLLVELRDRLGIAMMLITHDLGVVAGVCDRVGVMLDGRIVEEGSADRVLSRTAHPYTVTLVTAALGAGAGAQWAGAKEDSGSTLPVRRGCPFAGRCPRASAPCAKLPELRETAPDHRVACYFPEES
jgi:oligopeptide transport system ATP-binding protein